MVALKFSTDSIGRQGASSVGASPISYIKHSAPSVLDIDDLIQNFSELRSVGVTVRAAHWHVGEESVQGFFFPMQEHLIADNVHWLACNRQSRRKILKDMAQASISSSVDLSWLGRAMEGSVERSSTAEIVEIINGINSIIKDQQFIVMNRVFSSIDLGKMSPEKMLAVIRTTFPVRGLIEEWRPLLQKIKVELDKRGLNSAKILRGLE